MSTFLINVPDIHCDHCKTTIEGAVGSIVGVNTATVDVPSRQVSVDSDESVSFDSIKQAIEEQGYDVPEQS
jgi:copper chaperone